MSTTTPEQPSAVPDEVQAFGFTLKRAPFPESIGAVWTAARAENGSEPTLRFRPWASAAESWEAELSFAGQRVATGFAADHRSAIAGAVDELRSKTHALTNPARSA